MASRSKNYKRVKELSIGKEEYSIEEAVSFMKKNSYAKFDESVDVSVRLGVNPKHSDQMVRGTVVLPHGTGKKKKSITRIILFFIGFSFSCEIQE